MTERKLKPLVWHEKDGRQWIANPIAGNVYCIRKYREIIDLYMISVNGQSHEQGECTDLESAQEYCQLDFQRLIESCYE